MAGQPGQLLCERYRLVGLVGKGAMGQVWRGYDETLKRSVAVKEILLPEGLQETERDHLIVRTLREARAAARLHHRGIVSVYDVVQSDDVPWTVMEFVSGPSLQEVIARDGRLPWEQVAALGADLSDALAHAHAAGVVHRDLKPGNVLLAGRRAMLTDFGIARILDATTQLTAAGTIIGTPHYMAPEQVEGETIRAPVDLWALGATLFTLVEGCPPFDGPTMTAVLAAILTRPPPMPKQAGPMAPVLSALLSKAPGQRPDAATLTRQLIGLLRPGPPTLTVRSPVTAPHAAAATVVPTVRQESPVRAAVLGGHGGRVHCVAFSPTGRMLASGCDQGVKPDGSLVRGGRRVRLWDVASQTCTAALTGPEGAATCLTFSPEGELLVSGNSGQPVHLWRLGGRFRKGPVTLADDTDVISVAFSPDGTQLATGNCHKTVRLWDVAARTCLATLSGHAGWVHSVAFDRDGQLLATGSGDHTIRLWDVSARSCAATLTGHGEIVREVAFSPDGTILASGSVDQTIRLWDMAARTCVAVLTDGFTPVFCVAFSPDGSVLASGGPDSTVRLWDVATQACVATLAGHAKAVTSVAFSPDGTTLASGSHDRTVRLWRLR
jgi:WD40 repeat protein/tRNA A-37 threonylcarbamoyl transferase component Bud32